MKEVIIRDYRFEDLSAFTQLMCEYHHYDNFNERFSESLTEAHERGYDPYGYFTMPNRVWIAEIEDKIVGMMLVSIRGGSVKISLIVDEAYRRKGIGRKLIETLVQFVKEENLRKIYCTVAIHNTGTLAFLKKLGFVHEGYVAQDGKGYVIYARTQF
ncbi:MAG: GNAT family N-acetyltransferase [Minisyncoccia bacterium]